ncbi:MAG TPA: S24 family peptidase [Chloroflexota bacterium]|jgi:SOS-response transcriptional repressor LexA
MTGPGAFSWNSELPSGHNPFWIRDDGLSGLGLHNGDAVAVDTRVEPRDGDLVVAEAEIDGDSQRLARRYFATAQGVRLESVGGSGETLVLPAESVMVMGVITARVRFAPDTKQPSEEPL